MLLLQPASTRCYRAEGLDTRNSFPRQQCTLMPPKGHDVAFGAKHGGFERGDI